MDFQIDANNVKECFTSIAIELINQKELQINQTNYRCIDLEFYFFCNQHQDGYTHFHDEPAGKFRFHYSGMDITLRTNDKTGYGGILIRGIQDNNSKKVVKGPLLVLHEFSKAFRNINELNTFRLKESSAARHYQIGKEIIQKQRVNLRKPVEKSEYKNSLYRFVVKSQNSQKQ